MGLLDKVFMVKAGADELAERASQTTPICPDCGKEDWRYLKRDKYQCNNCGRILKI